MKNSLAKLFKRKDKNADNPRNASRWEREAHDKWWRNLCELYAKDNNTAVVYPEDPEWDAQKIYRHWLSNYL